MGATAEFEHTFSKKNVQDFADLCGDNNPIHLDAAFASTTRFKTPIVHGVLVSGLISTLFGRVLEGSIYVKQTLHFKSPVHIDGNFAVLLSCMFFCNQWHVFAPVAYSPFCLSQFSVSIACLLHTTFLAALIRVRMEVTQSEDKRPGKLLTCYTEVTLPDQDNIVAIKGESVVLLPKEL